MPQATERIPLLFGAQLYLYSEIKFSSLQTVHLKGNPTVRLVSFTEKTQSSISITTSCQQPLDDHVRYLGSTHDSFENLSIATQSSSSVYAAINRCGSVEITTAARLSPNSKCSAIRWRPRPVECGKKKTFVLKGSTMPKCFKLSLAPYPAIGGMHI